MEQVLSKLKTEKLRILVVWEPILPTDWRKPTSGTLSRISDRRAEQFWDPEHLVAHEIERDDPPGSVLPKAQCCEDNHTYWDMALIYPGGETWSAEAPAPVFRNGPVYIVWPQVEADLTRMAR